MKNSSLRITALAFFLCVAWMPGRSESNNHREPKPIAAWSFEKIKNGVIADESGHYFHALMHADAAIVERPGGGQALAFDGTGNNHAWWGEPQLNGLSIENRLPNAFQELSIEAWMCKLPGPWMSLVCRDLWDYPSGFGLVAEWAEGKVMFGHYDLFGHGSYAMSVTVVQDGRWHHVVGTMEPAGDKGYLYRIYVDGELDAQRFGQWAIEAAPAEAGILKIAYPNVSGSDNPYQGALDEIAIFDQALTPAQVKARYLASQHKWK